jgi:hypothetical protein
LDEKKMNMEFLRVHLVESPPQKDPHSTLGLGSGIFKQASNLMHLESLQLEIG